MSKMRTKFILKRMIDLILTILLIILMSFQIVGGFWHEWTGIGMTVVVIIHNILSIEWYKKLFKGNYNANRVLLLIINIGVVVSFALTALSGMAISGYAVPFLYGMIQNMTARPLHLAMSYWSMIMISLHLGLHWGILAAMIRRSGKKSVYIVLEMIAMLMAAFGFYVFIRDGIPSYLSFKSHFAMYDYGRSAIRVFAETLAQMTSWIFIATLLSKLLNKFFQDEI